MYLVGFYPPRRSSPSLYLPTIIVATAVVAVIIFIRSSFVVGPTRRRYAALALSWGRRCARWLLCCSRVGACSLCRGVLRRVRRLRRSPPRHIPLLRRRISPSFADAPPPSSPCFSLLRPLGTLFSSSSFPVRFPFRLRCVSTVIVVVLLLLGMGS